MTGVMQPRRQTTLGREGISAGPAPDMLSIFDANIELGQDRSGWNRDDARATAYAGIIDALPAADRTDFYIAAANTRRSFEPLNDMAWEKLQRARVKNPAFLPKIPADRKAFDLSIQAPLNEARRVNKDIAARAEGVGGTMAGLAGGMAGAMSDSTNIAMLPLGGGQATLARTMIVNGLINMGAETLTIPTADRELAYFGDTETAGQQVANVMLAGAAGSVLSGAFHGAPAAAKMVGKGYRAFDDAVSAGQEAALARILPHIPEKLRPGITRIEDVPDDVLATAFETMIGKGNLARHEEAGIATLRQRAEIDRINPYIADGAGMAAHEQSLGDAMRAILADTPAAAVPREARMRFTALNSRTLAPLSNGQSYDLTAIKALIRGPESGGNDAAVNGMGSSASGRYQFVKETFVGVYQRVYGGTVADAQAAWKNKRFDGDVQEALMDRLLADNAAILRRSGATVDNGNLYVMHVLGSGDGPKLLRAADDVPVASILSRQVVGQNPGYFGGGKSVSQSLSIIRGKVGGELQPGASASAAVDDSAGIAAEQASIDARRRDATRESARAPIFEPVPEPRLRPEFRDEMPHTTERIAVSRILVDAKTFQFKSDGDAEGVTAVLRQGKFNPLLQNKILLWKNKAGDYFVADGHQRAGMARRELAAGGPDRELHADVLHESDGISAQDAMTFAAIRNIADEKGTIADMAKVLRSAGPDALRKAGVAPNATSRHAEGAAMLSEDAFGAMVNKVIPDQYAARIGTRLPDNPELHMALVDLVAKAKPSTLAQADDVIRQGIEAGFFDGQQSDMFGALDTMASLFIERAKVKDAAMAKLRGLKRIFGTAAREADTLDAAGNKIDVAASAKEALGNDEALSLIDRLAFSGGPIKDAIDAAARRYASGEPLARVAGDLARDIRAIDLRSAAMDGANARQIEGSGSGLDEEPAFDGDTLSLFDDPASPAFDVHTNSVLHDLQMRMAAHEQGQGAPVHVQIDEGGETRLLSDVLKDIGDDEAAAATMRSCMIPGQGGGA
jgi:hypothetical protein